MSGWRGAVYNEVMQVESSTLWRDTSGGLVEAFPPAGGAVASRDVACHVHQLSPREMRDFALAGFAISHEVATEQDGIMAGWRLRLADDTLLRVMSVQHVRQKQGVPEFFRVMADEVRLS